MGSDHKLTRREFLHTAGLAGVGAVAVGMMSFRTPHHFDINHHSRELQGLSRPLRLSLLTDFHLGPNLGGKDLLAWIEASNAAEPDLVLIGGDIVDQRYRGDLNELRTLLPELSSRLGSYAVLGNHDRTRYRDLTPLEDALAEAGVELLVNTGIHAREDVYLAGIDDLRVGDADVAAALRQAPPVTEVDGALEGPARILLSHNPDVIPELPPSIGLLLAGHTHGGQIRLPGLGPLVTSSAYGARYAEGWVPAPMSAFVSRGLGVTALPFRFACPAEVVIIDLAPASTTA